MPKDGGVLVIGHGGAFVSVPREEAGGGWLVLLGLLPKLTVQLFPVFLTSEISETLGMCRQLIRIVELFALPIFGQVAQQTLQVCLATAPALVKSIHHSTTFSLNWHSIFIQSLVVKSTIVIESSELLVF